MGMPALGDAGPHLIAVRADPRGSQTMVTSIWGDSTSARMHPFDRESEKAIRGGASPSGIGGRKMHADITGKRAENGVYERRTTSASEWPDNPAPWDAHAA
jgi:hypothetical protein